MSNLIKKSRPVERFYLLDVLRFFLSIIVVIVHTQISYNKPHEYAAYLSVVFFFILSGYVLTHQIESSNISYKSFCISRIARIFPLYILSTASVIFMLDIPIFDNSMITEFSSQLFLLHNLGFTNTPGFNGVSWSLSAEFWVNIIIFYYMVTKNTQKRSFYYIIILASILTSYIILSRVALENGISTAFETNIQPISLITNAGVVACYMGLSMGYLIYSARNSKIFSIFRRKPLITSFFEILLIAFIYLCFTKNSSAGYGLLSTIAFCGLIILNSAKSGLLTHLSSKPIIRELGNLSYATYLMHIPVRIFMDKYIFSIYPTEQKVLLVVMLTIIVSIPIYYFFELRLKKVISQFLKENI